MAKQNCVAEKIAAYKKKTGRQPNQSIIGTYQLECGQQREGERRRELEIKEATRKAKKQGGPSY
tara:strand:+ start:421 stop:612 length:192 start_codon:yes stop_codon:yes gene_type:complete